MSGLLIFPRGGLEEGSVGSGDLRRTAAHVCFSLHFRLKPQRKHHQPVGCMKRIKKYLSFLHPLFTVVQSTRLLQSMIKCQIIVLPLTHMKTFWYFAQSNERKVIS